MIAQKVTREAIVDYETYAEQRNALRDRVMELKKDRRVYVGEILTFLFENTETVRYQIQEMMRAEQIVKESAIVHEIETYNELLGEEGELGCTLLIEIPDPGERPRKLKELLGLQEHVYLRLEDGTRVPATFDRRQVGEDRLSSVQYLKFKVGNGIPAAVGCDFPGLTAETELTGEQKQALLSDLGR